MLLDILPMLSTVNIHLSKWLAYHLSLWSLSWKSHNFTKFKKKEDIKQSRRIWRYVSNGKVYFFSHEINFNGTWTLQFWWMLLSSFASGSTMDHIIRMIRKTCTQIWCKVVCKIMNTLKVLFYYNWSFINKCWWDRAFIAYINATVPSSIILL